MPILSIILPVYNSERFIFRAIKSVLDQSFDDFELIIINDGSTDNSGLILQGISDQRIKIRTHLKNLGLIDSLNEGINIAEGKYIARLDADDICERDRFIKQIELLESDITVGVVGTSVKIIDENDLVKSTYVMPCTSLEIKWALPLVCPVVHPSVMMRAELFRGGERYLNDELHAEDYGLWGRLSQKVLIRNLQEPLLLLRKHDASVTASKRESHLNSATKISKLIFDNELGFEVPKNVISCIRTWGNSNGEFSWEAIQLLAFRHDKFLLEHKLSNSINIIRRDAAIRILFLSKNLIFKRNFFNAVHLALTCDNAVFILSASKCLRRLFPSLKRYILG
jgi:glycosyltransferase involved in cell wall biosynthesis